MKRFVKTVGRFFLSGDAAHWTLYGLISGAVFLIALNTTDSTLLKPAWVLWCSAGLVCLALYRILASGSMRIKVGLAQVLVALYVLASLMSLFNAVNARLGWSSLLWLMTSVVVFASAHVLVGSTKQINRFMSVLFALLGISCIIGVALRLADPSLISIMEISGRDMVSTFGNVSYFAGFLAAGIPLIFSKLFDTSVGTRGRIGLGLLLCLVSYVLVQTGTRSAWIGAAVAIGLYVLLHTRSVGRRIALLAVVVGVGLTVFLVSSDVIEKRLSSVFAIEPSSTVARRFFFFEGSWKAFLASPVIGNGVGNFFVVLPKFRSPDYWIYRSEDVVHHAHNEFLEILAETGIAGFIPWIVLVSYLSLIALRRLRSGPNPLLLGVWCSLVAILVDNLGNMSLRTVPVGVLFWILLGILSRNLTEPRLTSEVMIPKKPTSLRMVPALLFVVITFLLIRFETDMLVADQRAFEGNMLHFLKNSPDAIPKYEEALASNPYHEYARFNLASSLLQHGRYAEARDRALALFEEYPWYPKAHLIAAAALAKLGDTVQAARHFAAELSLRSHPQVYYFMSQMYRQQGMPREELAIVHEMLRQSIRGDEKMLVRYGVSRIEALCRGNCDSSISVLNEVGEKFSSDVAVLLAVGDCYDAIGSPENALQWYERARLLGPPGLSKRSPSVQGK